MSVAARPLLAHSLATSQPPRYSLPVAEKKAIRAWQPGHLALQAAPFHGYAAFVFSTCSAHGFAYGRPYGEGREPLPVPDAGLPTLHGLSPSLGRGGDRFDTCPSGVIMADTPQRAVLHVPASPRATASDLPPPEFLNEPVLFIDLGFGSIEFYGTRSQLNADGLIPGELLWPSAGQYAGWLDGPWHWTLRSVLRDDRRGKQLPRPCHVDYWRLRRHRMDESVEECEIRGKVRELAEMVFRSSIEGKAYYANESRLWWKAQQDAAFAKLMCRVLAFAKQSARHSRISKVQGGRHD